MATKRHGLILTLGGAPASPHVVTPLPGYYRPDVPHLVGGPDDDLTLAEAKQAVKDHPDTFELVEVDAAGTQAAEQVAGEDLARGRNALGEARRDGRAGDAPSRAKDEASALKKGDK
jgi:hypothetical protein